MEKNTETIPIKKKISKPKINIPIISKSEVKILFVCNGNICCSPMAEFIMKYLVNSAGLSNRVTINSSGCFADPEEMMDQGAVKELHRHQIPFIKKNAIQFDASTCDKYDYIICMAHEQIRTLSKGRQIKNIYLLMDFAGEHRNIFDPIFNGKYSEAYSIIYKGCTALLEHLNKIFANSKNANIATKKTTFSVSVNEDLLLRFEAALMLKHETIDIAIEKFMDNYTSKAAEILTGNNLTKKVKVPQANQKSKSDTKSELKQNIANESLNDTEIIERFIKKWAAGISQINHRIVKAYFKSIELNGKATFDSMKELCSNQKEYPGLYIYKNGGFENHYRQMKTSSVFNGKIKKGKGKNIDGKIFWEDNQEVKILTEVEPFLGKYRSYFTK